MTETAGAVCHLVAEIYNRPEAEITLASRLIDDLEGDSLDNLELTVAIEDQWDITVEDSEAEALRTVSDIIALVEAKVGAVREVGAA